MIFQTKQYIWEDGLWFNRLIEYNGEIKTLQQWADIIGVHSDKVRHRVNKGKTINEIYKLYNDGKSYFSDNSKDSILFN